LCAPFVFATLVAILSSCQAGFTIPSFLRRQNDRLIYGFIGRFGFMVLAALWAVVLSCLRLLFAARREESFERLVLVSASLVCRYNQLRPTAQEIFCYLEAACAQIVGKL
jgi:hypothetical protein